MTARSPANSSGGVPTSVFVCYRSVIATGYIQDVLRVVMQFRVTNPRIRCLRPFNVDAGPRALTVRRREACIMLLVRTSTCQVDNRLVDKSVRRTRPVADARPSVPNDVFTGEACCFSNDRASVPVGEEVVVRSFDQFDRVVRSSRVDRRPSSAFYVTRRYVSELITRASKV